MDADSFEAAYEDALADVPDEQFDRSRFVPGVGPDDADVMLVGEAPGADEVEAGEPFVGSAGGRLDAALDDAGVDRADLYVTNLVKVRPPENRDPHRAEIDAWLPVLDAEIRRVDPDLVVPLGSFATEELLDGDAKISEVHGERFEREGYDVVPAYHPAATFYSDEAKEAFAADVETVFGRDE
ncbi:uracil-DNA glycosylase [Candidatus Halobonum tyrrellensis]|uniref:Type-4 uracil-DNA glycosylase n=1 Tax=Candidatus Halobonum tyrrellensis G22 TaxID=1324957 RepID=V4HGX2_9EURY|nr:uracil-DNA glycosylase [Candidatus Halobonum tyrrellensis]ESP89960.1 DNA polymerase-like protein [Candidatus Halobonum tyrrellensis G22]